MKILSASLLLVVLICINSVAAQFTVSGNQLLQAGKPVLLRGVDRCSFEWNPAGQDASLADYKLMAGWGANVVRLSTNQDFWLSGSATYSSSYQATIAQQVAWIKQAGMYVIIDLHWSDQGNLQIAGAGQQAMADVNSITFWTQVATAYKNDPAVLFELYNEPFVTSWSVWLNGGKDPSVSYTTVGMQQLYNAVRATGANNVVIIGGINYAYDLSGVASNPVVGTNIMYNTHPYDYSGKQQAQWQASFGYLAATYPVMMTEFGQYCNTDSYVQELLAFAQGLNLHWTAWAWWVQDCTYPSIIADWNGTPLGTVGTLVQSYLKGSTNSSSSGSSSTSSGSSSGSQTTTPPPVATTAQVVYDDKLQNGWTDYSFTDKVNFANTSTVYAGSDSISVTLIQYGALYLHTSTVFDFGTYVGIQFFVNGGASTGASGLVVQLYDNSATPVKVGNAVTLPKPPTANSWVLESIPFSAASFGLSAGQQLTGFAIFDSTNAAGTINVDSITLITASSSSSTTASATTAKASTAAASTATTAKASTTAAATTATTAKASTTAAATTAAASTTGAKVSTTTTGGSTTGSSGACSASSISITQTPGTSWQSGGATIVQYAVTITNNCKTQAVTHLSLTSTNYNPVGGWGITVSGTTLSLPSGTTIAASGSYTGWGYQASVEATFTVTSPF